MKSLKFQPHLAQMIREGRKTTTWRLFDDKDLQVGDEIELVEKGQNAPFAHTTITKMVYKTLGSLQDEDWVGHEKFASEEEMYATYQNYYGPSVGPDIEVKIIWFGTIDL